MTKKIPCWRKPKNAVYKTALVTTALAVSSLVSPVSLATGSSQLDCDVAIVGGGPGGVHAAYKLATGNPLRTGVRPNKICLFEKQDHLGGRIIDVPMGKNGEVTGTAAYRMLSNHYTFHLYDELFGNKVNQYRSDQKPLNSLRGVVDPMPPTNVGKFFGYAGDSFKGLYGQTLNDDDIWSELLCGVGITKDMDGNPDYGSYAGIGNMSAGDYLKSVMGVQGAKYFKDMTRFRSDFIDPIDAVGYMEFNANDFAGGSNVYAIPGHSVLIEAMKRKILNKGGKIFLNQTVKEVSRMPGKFFYTVKSNSYTASAKSVIIATEAPAINNMQGNIVNDIRSSKFFKSITSATAVTVTHRWNKRWWDGVANVNLQHPNAIDSVPSNPILRMDTTIKSPKGNCLNAMELPPTDYHNGISVTRSVYVDDRQCVNDWVALYDNNKKVNGKTGIDRINQETLATLRVMFPKVFNGSSNEPKIEKTHFTYVPHAWFLTKKGSFDKGITNDTLWDWSVNPLANERVYLVGDSYKISWGWSASAYMSSARVLNEHYNFFGPGIEYYEFPRITCDGDSL